MKIFCTASKDTYITNKIIDSSYEAVDANVGQAGTLDLFKLYDENKLDGNDGQTELSRILVKFDLQKLSELAQTKININDSSFEARLRLFDVRSGHAVPKGFTIVAMPLNVGFDEGVGRDVARFGDLDVANYLTASFVNGSIVEWYGVGAGVLGNAGSPSDAITDFDPGDGSAIPTIAEQLFVDGTEDLSIDVTAIISGTLSENLPDEGFRISFSATEEDDEKTRFLKRFASRHSSNPLIHPRLEISYDDSIADDRGALYFNSDNRLFLRNTVRGQLRDITTLNLPSVLKITCDDEYEEQFPMEQLRQGTGDFPVQGTYYADVVLGSDDIYSGSTTFSQFFGSNPVTFQESWQSNDGNTIYHSSSFTVRFPEQNITYGSDLSGYTVSSFNIRPEYDQSCVENVRVFVENHKKQVFSTRKTTLKKRSEVLQNLHYRVKDAESGFIVFDFDTILNSTKTSHDIDGHYFEFDFGILPVGRTYKFEFLIDMNGQRKIFEDDVAFRVA